MAEVLVDHAAALGRDRDQDGPVRPGDPVRGEPQLLAGGPHIGAPAFDRGLGRLPTGQVVGDLAGIGLRAELLAAVLPQQPDRVGPALAAVAHHVHLGTVVARAAILQRLELLRSRPALPGQAVVGAVLGRGHQRHHVVQERAHALDRPGDLDQVLVVDPGDHHRVDLTEDLALGQRGQPFQLPLGQDLRRLRTGVALATEGDPRVDPRSDLGVGHVDGDRDVVDAELFDAIDVVDEGEAVGGHAQFDVRAVAGHQLHRGEGAARVRQRLAWPGDAEHAHLLDLAGDPFDLGERLLRGQQPAGDAGPALVRAVELAVAVVALDVAAGRDRHVHPGVVLVGFLAVTGMVRDLVGDLRVKAGSAAAAAPGRRAPTAGWRLLASRLLLRGQRLVAGPRGGQHRERDEPLGHAGSPPS